MGWPWCTGIQAAIFFRTAYHLLRVCASGWAWCCASGWASAECCAWLTRVPARQPERAGLRQLPWRPQLSSKRSSRVEDGLGLRLQAASPLRRILIYPRWEATDERRFGNPAIQACGGRSRINSSLNRSLVDIPQRQQAVGSTVAGAQTLFSPHLLLIWPLWSPRCPINLQIQPQ
jgi:hypothetical protein